MGAITAGLVDTGEKRDTRGRRVTPRERRLHLVQEYRGSRLTMAEFARRERTKYSTSVGWVVKAPRAVLAKTPIRFAEVRLPLEARSPTSGDQLDVRLPDSTVRRGGRVADVVALVRALRSLRCSRFRRPSTLRQGGLRRTLTPIRLPVREG